MLDLIFPMNLHITNSTEQTEFFIVLSHRQSESSFDSITTYLLGNLRSLQVNLLCSLELYFLFAWCRMLGIDCRFINLKVRTKGPFFYIL